MGCPAEDARGIADGDPAAYNEAITPPCGPTMVVIDIELQKEEARDMKVPAH
jgi:hypothetical protein